jgi:hypothetical protein
MEFVSANSGVGAEDFSLTRSAFLKLAVLILMVCSQRCLAMGFSMIIMRASMTLGSMTPTPQEEALV